MPKTITSAILLSAGRGERLRPYTDHIPKPLISVAGKPLIIHHLEKLSQIGIKNVVINISYLAEKIQNTLGDGSQFNLNITYSYEPQALETGGGIFQALSLLGDQPFLVISSDIYTDYDFKNLLNKSFSHLAHLILTPNPDYHTKGDFSVQEDGFLNNTPQYTYANIGLFHPDFFKECTREKFPLAPLLRKAIDQHQVTGELYKGLWYNIGSVEEWEKLKLL
jgi:MurNAc alpha-1-phosphate uridylyltransferase